MNWRKFLGIVMIYLTITLMIPGTVFVFAQSEEEKQTICDFEAELDKKAVESCLEKLEEKSVEDLSKIVKEYPDFFVNNPELLTGLKVDISNIKGIDEVIKRITKLRVGLEFKENSDCRLEQTFKLTCQKRSVELTSVSERYAEYVEKIMTDPEKGIIIVFKNKNQMYLKDGGRISFDVNGNVEVGQGIMLVVDELITITPKTEIKILTSDGYLKISGAVRIESDMFEGNVNEEFYFSGTKEGYDLVVKESTGDFAVNDGFGENKFNGDYFEVSVKKEKIARFVIGENTIAVVKKEDKSSFPEISDCEEKIDDKVRCVYVLQDRASGDALLMRQETVALNVLTKQLNGIDELEDVNAIIQHIDEILGLFEKDKIEDLVILEYIQNLEDLRKKAKIFSNWKKDESVMQFLKESLSKEAIERYKSIAKSLKEDADNNNQINYLFRDTGNFLLFGRSKITYEDGSYITGEKSDVIRADVFEAGKHVLMCEGFTDGDACVGRIRPYILDEKCTENNCLTPVEDENFVEIKVTKEECTDGVCNSQIKLGRNSVLRLFDNEKFKEKLVAFDQTVTSVFALAASSKESRINYFSMDGDTLIAAKQLPDYELKNEIEINDKGFKEKIEEIKKYRKRFVALYEIISSIIKDEDKEKLENLKKEYEKSLIETGVKSDVEKDIREFASKTSKKVGVNINLIKAQVALSVGDVDRAIRLSKKVIQGDDEAQKINAYMFLLQMHAMKGEIPEDFKKEAFGFFGLKDENDDTIIDELVDVLGILGIDKTKGRTEAQDILEKQQISEEISEKIGGLEEDKRKEKIEQIQDIFAKYSFLENYLDLKNRLDEQKDFGDELEKFKGHNVNYFERYKNRYKDNPRIYERFLMIGANKYGELAAKETNETKRKEYLEKQLAFLEEAADVRDRNIVKNEFDLRRAGYSEIDFITNFYNGVLQRSNINLMLENYEVARNLAKTAFGLNDHCYSCLSIMYHADSVLHEQAKEEEKEKYAQKLEDTITKIKTAAEDILEKVNEMKEGEKLSPDEISMLYLYQATLKIEEGISEEKLIEKKIELINIIINRVEDKDKNRYSLELHFLEADKAVLENKVEEISNAIEQLKKDIKDCPDNNCKTKVALKIGELGLSLESDEKLENTVKFLITNKKDLCKDEECKGAFNSLILSAGRARIVLLAQDENFNEANNIIEELKNEDIGVGELEKMINRLEKIASLSFDNALSIIGEAKTELERLESGTQEYYNKGQEINLMYNIAFKKLIESVPTDVTTGGRTYNQDVITELKDLERSIQDLPENVKDAFKTGVFNLIMQYLFAEEVPGISQAYRIETAYQLLQSFPELKDKEIENKRLGSYVWKLRETSYPIQRLSYGVDLLEQGDLDKGREVFLEALKSAEKVGIVDQNFLNYVQSVAFNPKYLVIKPEEGESDPVYKFLETHNVDVEDKLKNYITQTKFYQAWSDKSSDLQSIVTDVVEREMEEGTSRDILAVMPDPDDPDKNIQIPLYVVEDEKDKGKWKIIEKRSGNTIITIDKNTNLEQAISDYYKQDGDIKAKQVSLFVKRERNSPEETKAINSRVTQIDNYFDNLGGELKGLFMRVQLRGDIDKLENLVRIGKYDEAESLFKKIEEANVEAGGNLFYNAGIEYLYINPINPDEAKEEIEKISKKEIEASWAAFSGNPELMDEIIEDSIEWNKKQIRDAANLISEKDNIDDVKEKIRQVLSGLNTVVQTGLATGSYGITDLNKFRLEAMPKKDESKKIQTLKKSIVTYLDDVIDVEIEINKMKREQSKRGVCVQGVCTFDGKENVPESVVRVRLLSDAIEENHELARDISLEEMRRKTFGERISGFIGDLEDLVGFSPSPAGDFILSRLGRRDPYEKAVHEPVQQLELSVVGQQIDRILPILSDEQLDAACDLFQSKLLQYKRGEWDEDIAFDAEMFRMTSAFSNERIARNRARDKEMLDEYAESQNINLDELSDELKKELEKEYWQTPEFRSFSDLTQAERYRSWISRIQVPEEEWSHSQMVLSANKDFMIASQKLEEQSVDGSVANTLAKDELANTVKYLTIKLESQINEHKNKNIEYNRGFEWLSYIEPWRYVGASNLNDLWVTLGFGDRDKVEAYNNAEETKKNIEDSIENYRNNPTEDNYNKLTDELDSLDKLEKAADYAYHQDHGFIAETLNTENVVKTAAALVFAEVAPALIGLRAAEVGEAVETGIKAKQIASKTRLAVRMAEAARKGFTTGILFETAMEFADGNFFTVEGALGAPERMLTGALMFATGGAAEVGISPLTNILRYRSEAAARRYLTETGAKRLQSAIAARAWNTGASAINFGAMTAGFAEVSALQKGMLYPDPKTLGETAVTLGLYKVVGTGVGKVLEPVERLRIIKNLEIRSKKYDEKIGEFNQKAQDILNGVKDDTTRTKIENIFQKEISYREKAEELYKIETENRELKTQIEQMADFLRQASGARLTRDYLNYEIEMRKHEQNVNENNIKSEKYFDQIEKVIKAKETLLETEYEEGIINDQGYDIGKKEIELEKKLSNRKKLYLNLKEANEELGELEARGKIENSEKKLKENFELITDIEESDSRIRSLREELKKNRAGEVEAKIRTQTEANILTKMVELKEALFKKDLLEQKINTEKQRLILEKMQEGLSFAKAKADVEAVFQEKLTEFEKGEVKSKHGYEELIRLIIEKGTLEKDIPSIETELNELSYQQIQEVEEAKKEAKRIAREIRRFKKIENRIKNKNIKPNVKNIIDLLENNRLPTDLEELKNTVLENLNREELKFLNARIEEAEKITGLTATEEQAATAIMNSLTKNSLIISVPTGRGKNVFITPEMVLTELRAGRKTLIIEPDDNLKRATYNYLVEKLKGKVRSIVQPEIDMRTLDDRIAADIQNADVVVITLEEYINIKGAERALIGKENELATGIMNDFGERFNIFDEAHEIANANPLIWVRAEKPLKSIEGGREKIFANKILFEVLKEVGNIKTGEVFEFNKEILKTWDDLINEVNDEFKNGRITEEEKNNKLKQIENNKNRARYPSEFKPEILKEILDRIKNELRAQGKLTDEFNAMNVNDLISGEKDIIKPYTELLQGYSQALASRYCEDYALAEQGASPTTQRRANTRLSFGDIDMQIALNTLVGKEDVSQIKVKTDAIQTEITDVLVDLAKRGTQTRFLTATPEKVNKQLRALLGSEQFTVASGQSRYTNLVDIIENGYKEIFPNERQIVNPLPGDTKVEFRKVEVNEKYLDDIIKEAETNVIVVHDGDIYKSLIDMSKNVLPEIDSVLYRNPDAKPGETVGGKYYEIRIEDRNFKESPVKDLKKWILDKQLADKKVLVLTNQRAGLDQLTLGSFEYVRDQVKNGEVAEIRLFDENGKIRKIEKIDPNEKGVDEALEKLQDAYNKGGNEIVLQKFTNADRVNYRIVTSELNEITELLQELGRRRSSADRLFIDYIGPEKMELNKFIETSMRNEKASEQENVHRFDQDMARQVLKTLLGEAKELRPDRAAEIIEAIKEFDDLARSRRTTLEYKDITGKEQFVDTLEFITDYANEITKKEWFNELPDGLKGKITKIADYEVPKAKNIRLKGKGDERTLSTAEDLETFMDILQNIRAESDWPAYIRTGTGDVAQAVRAENVAEMLPTMALKTRPEGAQEAIIITAREINNVKLEADREKVDPAVYALQKKQEETRSDQAMPRILVEDVLAKELGYERSREGYIDVDLNKLAENDEVRERTAAYRYILDHQMATHEQEEGKVITKIGDKVVEEEEQKRYVESAFALAQMIEDNLINAHIDSERKIVLDQGLSDKNVMQKLKQLSDNGVTVKKEIDGLHWYINGYSESVEKETIEDILEGREPGIRPKMRAKEQAKNQVREIFKEIRSVDDRIKILEQVIDSIQQLEQAAISTTEAEKIGISEEEINVLSDALEQIGLKELTDVLKGMLKKAEAEQKEQEQKKQAEIKARESAGLVSADEIQGFLKTLKTQTDLFKDVKGAVFEVEADDDDRNVFTIGFKGTDKTGEVKAKAKITLQKIQGATEDLQTMTLEILELPAESKHKQSFYDSIENYAHYKGIEQIDIVIKPNLVARLLPGSDFRFLRRNGFIVHKEDFTKTGLWEISMIKPLTQERLNDLLKFISAKQDILTEDRDKLESELGPKFAKYQGLIDRLADIKTSSIKAAVAGDQARHTLIESLVKTVLGYGIVQNIMVMTSFFKQKPISLQTSFTERSLVTVTETAPQKVEALAEGAGRARRLVTNVPSIGFTTFFLQAFETFAMFEFIKRWRFAMPVNEKNFVKTRIVPVLKGMGAYYVSTKILPALTSALNMGAAIANPIIGLTFGLTAGYTYSAISPKEDKTASFVSLATFGLTTLGMMFVPQVPLVAWGVSSIAIPATIALIRGCSKIAKDVGEELWSFNVGDFIFRSASAATAYYFARMAAGAATEGMLNTGFLIPAGVAVTAGLAAVGSFVSIRGVNQITAGVIDSFRNVLRTVRKLRTDQRARFYALTRVAAAGAVWYGLTHFGALTGMIGAATLPVAPFVVGAGIAGFGIYSLFGYKPFVRALSTEAADIGIKLTIRSALAGGMLSLAYRTGLFTGIGSIPLYLLITGVHVSSYIAGNKIIETLRGLVFKDISTELLDKIKEDAARENINVDSYRVKHVGPETHIIFTYNTENVFGMVINTQTHGLTVSSYKEDVKKEDEDVSRIVTENINSILDEDLDKILKFEKQLEDLNNKIKMTKKTTRQLKRLEKRGNLRGVETPLLNRVRADIKSLYEKTRKMVKVPISKVRIEEVVKKGVKIINIELQKISPILSKISVGMPQLGRTTGITIAIGVGVGGFTLIAAAPFAGVVAVPLGMIVGGIGVVSYTLINVMREITFETPLTRELPKIDDRAEVLRAASERRIKTITSPVDKRTVVIGDIHASLDALKESLIAAGLIDTEDNWIGGDNRFIQTGDVIDRGPDSIECYDFLRELQQKAESAGGEVVRLLGNHELLLLQNVDNRFATESISDKEQREELRSKIIEDIKSGDVKAAYYVAGHMVLHGGYVPDAFPEFKDNSPEQIVDQLNERLVEAINTEDYENDQIFKAGVSREGEGLPGIFWADYYKDLVYFDLALNKADLPDQIVGHTPTRKSTPTERRKIVTSDFKKIIDIDVGHAEYYGGYRAQLIIKENEIFAKEPTEDEIKNFRDKASHLKRNGIIYGVFNPVTGRIVINIDATREAFKDELRGKALDKVQAFVFSHEILHAILARAKITLSERREEALADAFARAMINAEKPDDVESINRFIKRFNLKQRNPRIADLLDVAKQRTDYPGFFLNLELAGITPYNVEVRGIEDIIFEEVISREVEQAAVSILKLEEPTPGIIEKIRNELNIAQGEAIEKARAALKRSKSAQKRYEELKGIAEAKQRLYSVIDRIYRDTPAYAANNVLARNNYYTERGVREGELTTVEFALNIKHLNSEIGPEATDSVLNAVSFAIDNIVKESTEADSLRSNTGTKVLRNDAKNIETIITKIASGEFVIENFDGEAEIQDAINRLRDKDVVIEEIVNVLDSRGFKTTKTELNKAVKEKGYSDIRSFLDSNFQAYMGFARTKYVGMDSAQRNYLNAFRDGKFVQLSLIAEIEEGKDVSQRDATIVDLIQRKKAVRGRFKSGVYYNDKDYAGKIKDVVRYLRKSNDVVKEEFKTYRGMLKKSRENVKNVKTLNDLIRSYILSDKQVRPLVDAIARDRIVKRIAIHDRDVSYLTSRQIWNLRLHQEMQRVSETGRIIIGSLDINNLGVLNSINPDYADDMKSFLIELLQKRFGYQNVVVTAGDEISYLTTGMTEEEFRKIENDIIERYSAYAKEQGYRIDADEVIEDKLVKIRDAIPTISSSYIVINGRDVLIGLAKEGYKPFLFINNALDRTVTNVKSEGKIALSRGRTPTWSRAITPADVGATAEMVKAKGVFVERPTQTYYLDIIESIADKRDSRFEAYMKKIDSEEMENSISQIKAMRALLNYIPENKLKPVELMIEEKNVAENIQARLKENGFTLKDKTVEILKSFNPEARKTLDSGAIVRAAIDLFNDKTFVDYTAAGARYTIDETVLMLAALSYSGVVEQKVAEHNEEIIPVGPYNVFVNIKQLVDKYGGDYVRVFKHSDGSTSIITMDGKGHGLYASYMKALTAALLPVDKMVTFNDIVMADEHLNVEEKGVFFAAVSILNVDKDGTLYGFGGSGYSYHVTKDGQVIQLKSRFLPLGIGAVDTAGIDKASIGDKIEIKEGDRVTMFTDGVFEFNRKKIVYAGKIFNMEIDYYLQLLQDNIAEPSTTYIDVGTRDIANIGARDDYLFVVVEMADFGGRLAAFIGERGVSLTDTQKRRIAAVKEQLIALGVSESFVVHEQERVFDSIRRIRPNEKVVNKIEEAESITRDFEAVFGKLIEILGLRVTDLTREITDKYEQVVIEEYKVRDIGGYYKRIRDELNKRYGVDNVEASPEYKIKLYNELSRLRNLVRNKITREIVERERRKGFTYDSIRANLKNVATKLRQELDDRLSANIVYPGTRVPLEYLANDVLIDSVIDALQAEEAAKMVEVAAEGVVAEGEILVKRPAEQPTHPDTRATAVAVINNLGLGTKDPLAAEIRATINKELNAGTIGAALIRAIERTIRESGRDDVNILVDRLNNPSFFRYFINRLTPVTVGFIGSNVFVDLIVKIRDWRKSRKVLQISYDQIRELLMENIQKVVDVGEPAVEPLIKALKDENIEVRKRAATALGYIGSERAIEPLIEVALKDENWGVRWEAANALRYTGSERAVELLIKALEDENWEIRESAATALGSIKSERAVEPLIEVALKDENRYVREEAATALGSIKSERAVEPLIEVALKDENWEVRWEAANALRYTGSERAVELLIKALEDENIGVRESAATALGYIGNERAVEPLIKALKDENWEIRESAATALGSIKSERAIEPLIEALKDENAGVRIEAARALGSIGTEKTVELLIKALKNENKDIRIGAAEALGMIESKKTIEPLINALKDEDADVRIKAAEALGSIKSERAIEQLIKALKNENKDIRIGAAIALGSIKSEKAIEPLIEALKDENAGVRIRAATALGWIKSERAIEPLIEALKDEDASVRIRAAAALGSIKSERAIEQLIKALKNENKDIRIRAAEALGSIKSEKAIEPLIEALKDEDAGVREEAAEALGSIKSEKAIEPLIEALKDEDAGVRIEVAKALGSIKSEKAIEPLIEALKDENAGVRIKAAKALGSIRSEKAIKPLIEALKDEDAGVREEAAAALGWIGRVKPLIKALKNKNKDIRIGAARALGSIRSERAIEPLIEVALKDKNWEVRKGAAAALGYIGSERAVEPLIEVALKDENIGVRESAAAALGSIKSERAVELLIKALEDEKIGVRASAATALGYIGNERAIEPLIEVALKDENRYVRNRAADALTVIKQGDIERIRALIPQYLQVYYTTEEFRIASQILRYGELTGSEVFKRLGVSFKNVEGGAKFEDLDFVLKIIKLSENPYLKTILKDIPEYQHYSIIQSIVRRIRQLEGEGARVDVREVIDYIIQGRKNIANIELASKNTNAVIITHDEKWYGIDRFDNNEIKRFLIKAGVIEAKIENFKGVKDKTSALDAIRSIDTPTFIYLSGHGGPHHFWLTSGRLGEEYSDDLKRDDAISYTELAEALMSIQEQGYEIKNVRMVIDSCYSYDFASMVYKELRSRGARSFPIIITSTNREQVGYSISPEEKAKFGISSSQLMYGLVNARRFKKGPLIIDDAFRSLESNVIENIGVLVPRELFEEKPVERIVLTTLGSTQDDYLPVTDEYLREIAKSEKGKIPTPMLSEVIDAGFTGASKYEGMDWGKVYNAYNRMSGSFSKLSHEDLIGVIGVGRFFDVKIKIEYDSDVNEADYDPNTKTIYIKTTSREMNDFVELATVHELAEAAYRLYNVEDKSAINAHGFALMMEHAYTGMTREQKIPVWQARERTEKGEVVDVFVREPENIQFSKRVKQMVEI
ncbi:hypothetical protein DRJ17_03790 [Candidatus Woesearchaeota archaeon]|nr:MAG: hypothetical protein DRJ17_03790 [Candidatus Woesearchaeota archaeon]